METKKSSALWSNFKFVEKRKIWFMIPAIIVAIALIAGIVRGVMTGSPFKLSMDFTGGYSMTVNLTTKLTVENYPDYERRITEIAENLSDDANPNSKYGLKIDQMQHQGAEDPSKASILIRYKVIRGFDTDDMQAVNDKFKVELDKLFEFVPVVTVADNAITATYNNVINADSAAVIEIIKKQAAADGATKEPATIGSVTVDDSGLIYTIAYSGKVTDAEAVKFLTIPDIFSGKTIEGDVVSPVVGFELLDAAIAAIIAALFCMLVYITIRFRDWISGLVAVLALLHDVIIMFAFMTIFGVEIGSVFIAALITILGYSITNTIILFDRVREKLSPFAGKAYNPEHVADESVRDIFKRAVITTATTLIPITVIALIGVSSIQIFAFPIIIGLLAGAFSTICIAPSAWTMLKMRAFARAAKPVRAGAAMNTGVSLKASDPKPDLNIEKTETFVSENLPKEREVGEESDEPGGSSEPEETKEPAVNNEPESAEPETETETEPEIEPEVESEPAESETETETEPESDESETGDKTE